MELMPSLKRLPRYLLLGLYCACITIIFFCAIYTYTFNGYHYLRSYEESTATLYLKSGDSADVVKNAESKVNLERIPNNLVTENLLNSNTFRKLNDDKDDIVGEISATLSHGNFVINKHHEKPNGTSRPLLTARKNSTVSDKSSVIKYKYSAETKYVNLTIDNKSKNKNQNKNRSERGKLSKINRKHPFINSTCKFLSTTPKLILLWTPFFGSWEFLPQGPFHNCPCSNCLVTTDRRNLLNSDAVLFHVRDMNLADIPAKRLPHQRWIFYCLESPPYSDFPGLHFMKNMFNWTMTYRLDSDVIVQYGGVAKVRPKKKVDFEELEDTWRLKTKSVVWMSSHCPTHGGRDLYVSQLKKYIDVDEYGSCGTLSCPIGATEECLKQFTETYHFFLAFENSICKDYVTEKFFRTLKYNIIPVVFGGAKYEKMAPVGSYIDALSFKSPKHLAYFLSGVSRDFSLYKTYFEWREDYVVQLRSKEECSLCRMLHNPNIKQSSYSDLKKWWVQDGRCRSWIKER